MAGIMLNKTTNNQVFNLTRDYKICRAIDADIGCQTLDSDLDILQMSQNAEDTRNPKSRKKIIGAGKYQTNQESI